MPCSASRTRLQTPCPPERERDLECFADLYEASNPSDRIDSVLRSVNLADRAWRPWHAMTSFFENAKQHLSDKGRMLIFFGTSGDLDYLQHLFARHGFSATVVAHDSLSKDGWAVDYFTYRCEPV